MTITGGSGVHGVTDQPAGGQASAQPAVVIDFDELPAWATEAMPDWVERWLIPMLSAGQKWPEASESGLSGLAVAYQALAAGASDSTPRAGAAARVLVTGWNSPPAGEFVNRARLLYGQEGGITGVSGNAQAYSQQANDFAVETQYSKIAINVAFWITVIAISIALLVSFFTAGSSTAIIGPYAAAARAAITRILVRLMTLGGRQLGATQLARVTALSGATGRGAIARLLGSSIGRELIEEIGEEFFIDAYAQYQQIKMGTRQEWDWQKSGAAIIGAGTGAVIGTQLAGPVSRITSRVPGFAGRALTTGTTNMIASPAGSFIANGVVYGQWQNPFTVDSMLGGFMGGAGRTGSISPFSPDVYSALRHPVSSLAGAYDAAARTDAGRAGGDPPPNTTGQNPSGGGPNGDGGQSAASTRVPEPARTGGGTSSSGASGTNRTGGGVPDIDSSQRRGTGSPNRDDQNRQPDDASPRPEQDATPAPSGDDPGTTRRPDRPTTQPDDNRADDTPATQPNATRTDDTPAAQPNATRTDDTTTQPNDPTAQPDGTRTDDTATQPNDPTTQPDRTRADDTATQPDGSATRPDDSTTPPDQGQQGDQNGTQDRADAPDRPSATADQATAPDDATRTSIATSPTMSTAPAADPATAVTRARDALIAALSTDFPDSVIGSKGDVLIVSGRSVHTITAARMARIRAALITRAMQVQNVANLRAEATAMLLVSQTGTAPDRPPAHTSRPGTVTSNPVPGTRYVTDGRQGSDVALDALQNAVAGLSPDHFIYGEVTDLTWSKADGTLIVRTKTNGTHHFRPVVGGLSSNLMGKTDLRTGADPDNAHLVHFNPRVADDQLTRVWLHEISHALQELAATAGDAPQGFLRRRRNSRRATQDACVAAQVNEMAYLADNWRRAQTMQEKRLLAIDIDGLSRQLRKRGQTPPLPPWVPTQAVRPAHAPPVPTGPPTAEQVETIIEALRRAEQAIDAQVASKRAGAQAAADEARTAEEAADKAQGQHDQGSSERARKAREDVRKHADTQARHTRIADAYEAVKPQATQAREAYERLLAAMRQAGRPAQYGEVSMASIAASLVDRARQRHEAYLKALKEVLPQDIILSTTMPTGRLAHLNRLTDTVNGILENNEVPYRFTAEELERALRGDFHKVVAPDGVVLRVGEGSSAAELRIRLSLSDLVEVLDPAVKASEMMIGTFFTTGRSATATESGSFGRSRGFNTGVLAQFLAEGGMSRAAMELLGVGIGIASGRNSSATGGGGMYAQGGSVTDNRSESLLFDAAATWTVDIRTRRAEGWQQETTVNSGTPGDVSGQRVWISHAFTDAAPNDLVRIAADKRNPEMPNHVLTGMTGLEEALDTLARELGAEYTQIGSVPRDQLRKFVTDEHPHRMRAAVNEGITRVILKDGRPHARVSAKTRVVLEESTPQGAPTADVWGEEVLVDVAAMPGGASTSGSAELNVSAGVNAPMLAGVNGPGDYAPNIGPRVKGSRSASRSYAATANKQAIHPSVHRQTGHQQSYRLVLETTYTVEIIGKSPVTLAPIRSEAMADMRESDAYRFGLDVDRAALIEKNGQPLLDADGNQVLRGDPDPGPPPGRKAELPVWLGDGPGQMRGAGPALVDEIAGLDDVRRQVLDGLAERGIIPTTVNGVPQYSSDPLTRASQILNLQEVTEQLSEHRIRSAYDTLAQEGIPLDLTVQGRNRAPEHYTLRISLEQDFTNPRYIGHSTSKTVVNLDIGSDTSARGIGRSRTYGGNASVSESDGPDEGNDGLSHEAGVNGGGNRTRTAGSSVGGTVNVVTLQESTGPVAIFSVSHVLRVDLLHNGETTRLTSDKGSAKQSAKLLFAADFLPPDSSSALLSQPEPLGKMSKKLLSRARLLHMDMNGLLPKAEKILPRGMKQGSTAYAALAAFLSVRNLVAHPKLLRKLFTSKLAISAEGMRPGRSELSVRGEVGEAEVLGIVDQVNGNILFGLGSAGVSWGGSSGVSVGASMNVTDLDDGGTSTDGGSLSLPSRSGSSSESTSILDIWGTEELTIEHGRQYILRAPVDLLLTGAEGSKWGTPPVGARISTGEGRPDSAQGTALFALPEYDALLMYSQGEIKLPGPLVADAIERFVNGSLTLDASLAVPLVQQYLKDVAQAGKNAGYAARHTPEVLLEKLKEVTGLGGRPATGPHEPAGLHLARTLTKASELLDRARQVVLAPSYDRGGSISSIESLTLTDNQGNDVDVIDAVTNAVRAAAPDALTASPTLADELDVDFSDDAAKIHVVDMWSARGYEKSYHVQAGPQGSQAEEVIVRARLEYDDPADSRMGTFLTHTSQAGVIVQHYRYNDRSHSESYNGSYSAGLDYSGAGQEYGGGGGVSTDRGRGFSGSVNRQGTRLQRLAVFNGLNRVQQTPRLVIEVERRPVRGGRVPGLVHAIRHRSRSVTRVEYRAELIRRIPTGMIRPVGEDPGPVQTVPDHRQVELHPGHFPESLWEHADRPSLYEIVTAQLTKMLGAHAVQERRAELVKRLSASALLTAFERMATPTGEVVVRAARQKFKDQGTEVGIKARLSDLTIVAGPFEAEKGEVDRKSDAQNTTVSRSRTLPVGAGGSYKSTELGIDAGVRIGEQTGGSVTDHHGARRELTKLEKGKAYTVRLRVDYDLTFQHVARLRDGNEHPVGDPVRMLNATSGEVDVTLFAEEIEELKSRMEANVRLAPPSDPAWPTVAFAPARGRQGLIQILRDALLAAREKGVVARVAVREADGVHRFLAAPDGSLRSEEIDGGFAEAFATLPPGLLDAAEQAGLDLRDVFMNSGVPGTFTDQVTAELGPNTVDPGKPAWPAEQQQAIPTVGGSVAQGTTTSAPSPAIEGTPFSRSGRPAEVSDLTLDELRAQDVSAADLGGAAAHMAWGKGNALTLQVPGAPDQHLRVLIEDPGDGLNAATEIRAGTPDDPHLLRIWGRTHPDVVSSVMVHELSHATQAAVATAAGAPQGVIRPSVSEGTDHCLMPRLNEHAHLSRKWRAAGDQATRARLADAIDAIASDIERRGHTPPPPPWGTGPRAPAPEQPQSRLARLLSGSPSAGLDTSAAGLDRLADVAGVAEVTPVPGAAREFTVSRGGVAFTLALSEGPDGAGVTVGSRERGRLALNVPVSGGTEAMIAVAEQIAAHAATLADRLSGPETSDAATLARLRGLIATRTDGDALRVVAERAGLAPGQAGSAAKLLALARAGELSPAEVTAIRGWATLPEAAAATAFERGAALMGARVHAYGAGLMDIVLPGRAPIPVEVRADQAGPASPGMLTFEVDGRRTIGANERAAAATAARAVAEALGTPSAPHERLAELNEAMRQVRSATATQRPARLGVLFDLLTTAGPEVWPLIPQPVAAELTTLANGHRPRDWPAIFKRLRDQANTTGWFPPEECRCPADEPCRCGRGEERQPGAGLRVPA
ncbi:hypothetical protein ACFOY2_23450 [Nonomuraea purpurea]|uniref:Outer membrane channel protein CpnT-like N-terminal domain-containing protein n=1 Tax=Nonomuraea purpurea TaxID=1849276 RepID=A0ABV8G896_9ACTN